MSRPFAPERRAEVLDEAIDYLARNGLANLSIRKLAKALGTSTTVVTYQFGSKAALVEAALNRARSANLGMLEGFRDEHPGATTAEGFVAIWDWWGEASVNLAFSRIDMEAMMVDGAVTVEKRRDLITYWLDYFSAWLCADGHELERAKLLATLLMAVQSGVTIDLLSTGDAGRARAAVHAFAEVLVVNGRAA